MRKKRSKLAELYFEVISKWRRHNEGLLEQERAVFSEQQNFRKNNGMKRKSC
jgi:hypothetical protein